MENTIKKIKSLLKSKNAIIIAHNYQPQEICDIADMCGDSLELSIKASKSSADIIVFCGVMFMAETASILSADKKIILPNKNAGCDMADMVTPLLLEKKIKELGKDIPVVTYVNSSAEVKANSTICCTSANAVEVVNSLKEDEVLMIPDKNLARYVQANSKKKIHFWDGYCPIHNNLITKEKVLEKKQKYKDAIFIVHPECSLDVIQLADVVTSTSGMIKYAKESKEKNFIIGTEIALLHSLKKQNPDKNFYPASSSAICADMKKITLDDIIESLEQEKNEVRVSDEIRKKAFKAVDDMVKLSLK